MTDDKKDIGPETEKPGEAPQEKKAEPIKDTLPAPERSASGAPQAPMVETTPKAPPTTTVENQTEENAAPAPKVLDFSAAKISFRQRRKQLQKKARQGADGRKVQVWPIG